MILIPELETVVILVPRTGSGSLRRAVAAAYPRSMLIYRHMEADGVPAGYDRWRRVGVVREPLDRLWSLYKFMRQYENPEAVQDDGYVAALRRSARPLFTDWICDNETVFTSPYDSANQGRFWPQFTVRHALPENRKSQHHYLRPDLGTEVWRFDNVNTIAAARLGLAMGRENTTLGRAPPPIHRRAADHIAKCFAWDVEQTR